MARANWRRSGDGGCREHPAWRLLGGAGRHRVDRHRRPAGADGGVVSRQSIAHRSGPADVQAVRCVDIHIHRLRTKLREFRDAHIDTVRVVGYRISRQWCSGGAYHRGPLHERCGAGGERGSDDPSGATV
ncbi:MAG: helix-turn-helix domain-containing protein [Dehalococcoidia bacterium]|nr:helix-turn-helix domain-containing protein [Dehalococcoidia bacterium]